MQIHSIPSPALATSIRTNPQPIRFNGSDDAPKKNSAPKKKKFDINEFKEPTPFKPLMRVLGPINRFLNLHGTPILRNIPFIEKVPFVGPVVDAVLDGVTLIRKVDFPKADLERLKKAVNPQTAAFMGPNHPEFYTDWMLDKEISYQVAPYMASWATHEVVNGLGMKIKMPKTLQKFWLMNNLVAQIPGQDKKDGKKDGINAGKEYSVQCAMRGDGVLLHPEGTVRWHNDKIGFLFPGIVEMAVEANKRLRAKGDTRPVYIAPIIWKLQFTEDVSKGLADDMGKVEKRLGLPNNKDMALMDRFKALQENILARQIKTFEVPGEVVEAKLPFFDRQEAMRQYLMTRMETKYGPEDVESFDKRFHRLSSKVREHDAQYRKEIEEDRETLATLQPFKDFNGDVGTIPRLQTEAFMNAGIKAIELAGKYGVTDQEFGKKLALIDAAIKEKAGLQKAEIKADKAVLEEIRRLNGFTREFYNTPHLTQEHIAENIKRIKQEFFQETLMDNIIINVPRPVGPRTAHIRIPEPINLTERLNGKTEITKAETEALIAEIQAGMQAKIDEVNAQIQPEVAKFQKPNPFYVAG